MPANGPAFATPNSESFRLMNRVTKSVLACVKVSESPRSAAISFSYPTVTLRVRGLRKFLSNTNTDGANTALSGMVEGNRFGNDGAGNPNGIVPLEPNSVTPRSPSVDRV